MSVVTRTLLAIAAAGAITLQGPVEPQQEASLRRGRPVSPSPVNNGPLKFSTNQLEFYLTDDGVAYIRPGLKVKVNSITIGADRKPVVDVTYTDDLNQPLHRQGEITPGAISLSFILAKWDPVTRNYTSYTTRSVTTPANSPRPGVTATQAAADSGGTWTDLEVGHSTYKFRTALPEGYDGSATTTLGIYGSRNLTAILGKNYYANVLHDFLPAGGTVAETWDKITTAACNNCHDPISAHGGSRREVKLCVLCHSPQTPDPDTGHTMDMETLVHKLHFGANLPSVQAGTPYIIIGNQQSVHDYSHVVFPQDMRNCDNCHEGITAAQKPSQSHLWFSAPTKEACFACHDQINLVTGEGHPGGPQNNNALCSTCHLPDSGNEFDASIKGAHTIPEKSKQLAGLNATIVSATNMKAGEKPTVVIKLTNGDGTAVDGSKITSFAPMIAGPTSDYTKYFREAGQTRATFDAATGNTTYTFTNAIPADATGSWVVSGDFYRTVTLKRADGEADITGLREAAFNPIKYYSLTEGGVAEPRRTSVSLAACNSCHDRLALHGGQRLNTQECVICHNPKTTDVSVRPATEGAAESIQFAHMIHRIHSGEELTRDFTVFGRGGSRHNYNEVVYPGDRRNCDKCHVSNSEQLPPAGGNGETVITLRDFFSPQGPGTAACLGCHDSRDAAAHAYLNTTNFGGEGTFEACAVCHGPGADWAVDKVHAR